MAQDKTRPLLSLCMIVKNEAEHLETCLRLARPHVDEIVIIDTGSTDGTQDIARRYADVFEEIEWPNSFAAARNYSLDRAHGKYILILDGDEYIADPRDWHDLRSVIETTPIAGIRLRIRNLLPSYGLMEADVCYQERIFPNDPTIRYSGRVHNQIWSALVTYHQKTGYPILDVPIEVIHVGYTYNPEKMKQKYRPRLPLLEQEYKEANTSRERAYYGYQLAAVYYVLQDYEKALNLFNELDYKALAQGNINNAFYAQLLAVQAALKLNRGDEALFFSNGMLSITRNEPIAYFLAGTAFLLKGQIENGILFISESIEINEKNKDARFPLNMRMAFKFLGHLLRQINLVDLAQELDALQDKHYNKVDVQRLLQRLKTLMVLSERKKAAA